MATSSDDLEIKSATLEQLETATSATEVIDTAGMREAHPDHPRVGNSVQQFYYGWPSNYSIRIGLGSENTMRCFK
jgi:hypothetical protein